MVSMGLRERIAARVEQAIRERVFPGCVIGTVRDGKYSILPFGHLRYEGGMPVDERTIYDLASITKSIPTSILALEMLDLERTVSSYLPELERDFGATVSDLLMYRVGGPRMSMLANKTGDEIVAHILQRGFDAPPGRSEYSNLPAFLLGLILELETHTGIDRLADEQIFQPLCLERTSFMYARDSDVAPTEIEGDAELRGIVQDESARAFAYDKRAVGHAGLFSDTHDLLLVLEALLRGGFPNALAGAQRGFGWHIEGDLLGSKPQRGFFGKTGFTGTSVTCDAGRSIGLVILSNRTYPHRPKDSSAINAFRRDIVDIVMHA